MRYHLLRKRSVGTAILVALAAGTWSVPAGRAQTPAPKKAASKSTTPNQSTSSTTKTSSARKNSSRKRTKRQKGQAAPTPDRISEIQTALAKNGSYSGAPSGKLDEATLDSIRKFQTTSGLRVTGKLDAPTLQKLGLGSETAGVAAPTPPPNTSNRLISSSSSPSDPRD